jgi:uracil-DNA glycosylase family 4
MPNYVPGSGPIGAELAFIGEAPGEIEDKEGKSFVGPAGNLLWAICDSIGIRRRDVYVTNVLKYRPPNNQFWRAAELGINTGEEIAKLRDEINTIDPNCVVMFGANTFNSLIGKGKINNWRGSILWWNGRKAVPTIHPAHILHSEGEGEDGEGDGAFKYWMKYLIGFDIQRAIKHSKNKDYRLPSRVIQPCTSYYDLHSFISRQRDTSEMAEDIEAAKGTCMPVCIGISFSKYDAMSIPLYSHIPNTDKLTGVREADLPQIWHTLGQLNSDPKVKKIGQNFKYDEDKTDRLGLHIDKLWVDTSLLAHTLYPEFWKSLAFLTSICTEQPYYKDEGKLFDPAKDDFNQLLKYNGMDAACTKEVKDVLYAELVELGMTDFFHEFIMPLHKVYLDMERVGFHVDEKTREELIRKYAKWSAHNEMEMFFHLGFNVNANSWKQVGHVVYSILNLPRRGRRSKSTQGGTGEQVLSGLLLNVVKKERDRRVLELVLTERRVTKALGPQYLLSVPDYDGRIKSTWNLVGTETGRTSTKMLKAPIRPQKMGISFHTFTKHGDIGGDIRRFLKPAPGKVLVQIDSSQAEARVCMLLAEDYETLSLMDELDLHALTASWIFGGTWQDHSKEKHGGETPERFIGKTTRHSGHLDIRKGEFARNTVADARKYGIKIGLFSEWKAGKILDTFHNMCPRIRGTFHQQIVDCLEKDRTLVAPAPIKGLKHGGRRTFHERWGRELWKQAYAYIPQRTVSDNTKSAMIDLKKKVPDIELIGESHDSILFQRDKDDYIEVARIAQRLIERPIDFSGCSLPRKELMIPSEVEVGDNYKDFRKVKT